MFDFWWKMNSAWSNVKLKSQMNWEFDEFAIHGKLMKIGIQWNQNQVIWNYIKRHILFSKSAMFQTENWAESWLPNWCRIIHDRASIVVLRERTPAVRWRSSWVDDRDCVIKLLHDFDDVSLLLIVHRSLAIERSRAFHVAPRWEENWEISWPCDESTRHQVCIPSNPLIWVFSTCVDGESRGLGSTRSMVCAWIWCLSRIHVTCTCEILRDIVPHGIKKQETSA